MIPDNQDQIQKAKPKRLGKVKIVIIIILVIGIFGAFVPPEEKQKTVTKNVTRPAEETKIDNKLEQQDFKKLYHDTLDIIYAMKKPFYVSSQMLTRVPKTTSYKYFKDSEKIYQNCSVYFTMANVPDSLKDYKNEIDQSNKELANVCVMLQEHCKYFADYINTSNLESLQKSDDIIAQQPIKIISNASSRLVYGVGEKIGLDPKPFDEAYKAISDKIPKEFEAEYGN